MKLALAVGIEMMNGVFMGYGQSQRLPYNFKDGNLNSFGWKFVFSVEAIRLVFITWQ
jgi:hypothetical protein